ncbi:addiction module toxin, HicA family [Treponema sp. OMZ 799]|uniref:type II toxin-antitoxin system HicA family toxin n=1 Tax=Treponema sp. OMZ 799 TaxID=2563668 RepID=UPI0020A2FB5E|nr:type II toxin-antitoxin system HicA family toxin [Treponema sp. OMZ 799]UTC77412.1 addiction module toxin, HicA family [Treponema sp. OMZ 799]
MAQWEKLLEKIKSLDKNMRFSELAKVLKAYGYVMTAPRSGSSHYTFRKKGCNPITIPNHEPIKSDYVRMVKEVVEEEESNQKEK